MRSTSSSFPKFLSVPDLRKRRCLFFLLVFKGGVGDARCKNLKDDVGWLLFFFKLLFLGLALFLLVILRREVTFSCVFYFLILVDVFYVLADVRGAELQLLWPGDGHLASLWCRGDLFFARERKKRCLKLNKEVVFIGAVGYYCITPQKLKLGVYRLAHPHPTGQKSFQAFSGSRCAIVLTFHSSSPLVSSVQVNINYIILCSFGLIFVGCCWSDVLSSRATSLECKMWTIKSQVFSFFLLLLLHFSPLLQIYWVTFQEMEIAQRKHFVHKSCTFL